MPTEPARIAVRIWDVFEGQTEGYFAISILALSGLATLLCATFYLVQRLRQ